MSLRQRRREHVEQLILEAATRAFSAGGYHGTSMEDVAREVDCAAATLYGYFKGKGELFTRLMADKTADYLSGLAAAIDGSEGFEAGLDAYLDHWAAYARKNEAFLRIIIEVMVGGGAGHNPEPEQMEVVRQAYLGLIQRIMQRGIDEEALREENTTLLSEALIGMTHSLTFAWLHGDGPPDIESTITLGRHIFLRGATTPRDGAIR